MTDSHQVLVPGTRWQAWRWAMLRSAGFPADGPRELGSPSAAQAADAYLGGDGDEATFVKAFEEASAAISASLRDIAADPLFRTALLWQNPTAARTASSIARDTAARRHQDRRREESIAKYWQRYCLKNDTAGFFGPVCWVRLEAGDTAIEGEHGPSLVRQRAVYFERWALSEIAAGLAEDPRVRPWLPVLRQPHLTVRDGALLVPGKRPAALPAADAALLASCDGSRSAHVIASLLASGDGSPFRSEADVYTLIGYYVEHGTLRWGPDLPMSLDAERVLRDCIETIGDREARAGVSEAFGRLCACRDALAAASGPDEVAMAMATAEDEFSAITGTTPRRRPGEAYAGRTLFHLETVRDLDLAIGDIILARLEPLEPLLLSARWLTAALADALTELLTTVFDDLAGGTPAARVPFADLCYLAVGSLLGADPALDKVLDDYRSRWSAVLGLDMLGPRARRLDLTGEEVMSRVRKTFDAARPGWADARIHSPDVLIAARDADAVRRGDFTLVLGELHIAMPALDTHFFTIGHPDPGELVEATRASIPGSRVRVLTPPGWPRRSARNAMWITGPDDVQLGWSPADGADWDRLLPATALTVTAGADGLTVSADDGRSWPIAEVFADMLDVRAFDAWKLVAVGAHTPRVTIDGMVIIRETWRMTIGETGLAAATGERARYLAVRGLRGRLGLPDHVFVKVESEEKPCYADLTSPVYARILCGMLRRARERAGQDGFVAITEMLPAPGEAWLADAAGRRYSSELRMHICDPETSSSPSP